MKVINITNQVHFVRHWGKWYRVQRGGAKWERLAPIIKNGRLPRVATIESAAASLPRAQASALDTYLDK